MELGRQRPGCCRPNPLSVGQPAAIKLDGFPELSFTGRVEHITTLAVGGHYSSLLRAFTAVVFIKETHAQLLPDLTASVEIAPAAPFYPAEPYHQQYLSEAKNPNGYCGLGGTGASCPIGVAKADG